MHLNNERVTCMETTWGWRVAQEFQKSAEYKKYLAVAKPKAKAAGRNEQLKWQHLYAPNIVESQSGKAKAVKKETKKGPPIPDSMPKKPPKAMALFMAANKGWSWSE